MTHADGSQSVECVEDDLGLQMPRDAPEILATTQGQGIDAVAVDSPVTTTRNLHNKSIIRTSRRLAWRRCVGGRARGFIILKRRLSKRATNGEVSRDGFLASCRDAGVSGSDATDAQLRGVFEGLQSQGRAPLRACLGGADAATIYSKALSRAERVSRLDVDGLNRVASAVAHRGL